MSEAIMPGQLIFPQPQDQWQIDLTNTLNPWVACVNSTLSALDTAITTLSGWCVDDTQLCNGNMSIDSSAGMNFNGKFCVNNTGCMYSTEGSIAGWSITTCCLASANISLDSCAELIKVGNPAGVHIQIDGTNDRIRTSDFVTGAMGEGWQIGTDITEFQNIRARGKLSATVFEKETISAVGGGLTILDAETLCSNMSASDSECITVTGKSIFSNNDILRIKTATEDEWFKTCCHLGANVYCVSRDMATQYDANDNPTWTKGAAVINYGQSGQGGIYMTSQEQCSPYISVFTHACEPWVCIENQVRLGRLDGVSSGTFGTLSGYGLWAENAYLEGQIVSCSAKFIDPSDADNYSFIDAGSIKFHDALGDVPYVKRICSGLSSTGCTVQLNGWTSAPEVIVSPNSLMSYNCSNLDACQVWCVYADTPLWYCSSSTCYGYCFDVHASLNISQIQCGTCTQNVAFGTTCFCTYANVAASCVCYDLQRWTYPTGTNTCYCVGCSVFETCYRVKGAGTWEGSCCFEYLQASGSCAQITTNGTVNATITFPCAAEWELMTTEVSSCWIPTAVVAGALCCGACLRQFDTSVSTAQYCCFTDGGYSSVNCVLDLNLTGSNPLDGIYHQYMCISWRGEYRRYANYYYDVDRWACFCTYITDDYDVLKACTKYHRTQIGSCCYTCTWGFTQCYDIAHTCDIDTISLNNTLIVCDATAYASSYACNVSCICGTGQICQEFCYYDASAATCSFGQTTSTSDTTGDVCQLDNAGTLTWLAISYS